MDRAREHGTESPKRKRPSLQCKQCGYEAPDRASRWDVHEQGDPRMGNPLVVYECPDCQRAVDVGVLMSHEIG